MPRTVSHDQVDYLIWGVALANLLLFLIILFLAYFVYASKGKSNKMVKMEKRGDDIEKNEYQEEEN